MKFYTIIPASGSGTRYKSRTPKQFLKIEGKEIIAHVLQKFSSLRDVEYIVISAQKNYFKQIEKIVINNDFKKVKCIVKGGKERMDSVFNALCFLNCNKDDFVIVHDAVRPFVSMKKLSELINTAKIYDSAVPALKINDTVKKINRDNFLDKDIERDRLYRIQTPQIFRYDILMDSYNKAYRKKFLGTDESSIVQFAGYPVKIVEGEATNIKITTKDDLNFNELFKLLNK